MLFATLRSTLARTFASLLNGSAWGRAATSLLLGLALIGLNTGSVEAQETNLYTRAGIGLSGVYSGGATAVGDVNDDGNLDFVVTGEGPSPSLNSENPTATLYLGDGSGGVTAQEAGLTEVKLSSTAFGDVNNDGDLDLVITGEGPEDEYTATLYLGDGSGGFTAQDAGLTGVIGSSSTFGDVNNDGNLDLLITGQEEGSYGPNTTLYLGDGSGGFTEHDAGLTDVGRYGYDSASAFGDVNNDGDLDLVLIGQNSGNNTVTELYLGDGEGGFTKQDVGLANVYGSAAFGDVNDDGDLDLVLTGYDPETSEQSATLYLGDGSGGFTEQNAGLAGVSRGSSTFGDVNDDGNLDLVITGSSNTTLYLGDGSGGFSPAEAGLTSVYGDASLGDVDGDGDEDLVVVGDDDLVGESARLYINRTVQETPNQSPQFGRVPSFPSALTPDRSITRYFEVGDQNGDALSLSLTEGSSADGVSFTDVGNGIAELSFAPTRSQAGQTVSFAVEASDGNGETATAGPLPVEVGDDFAFLEGSLAGSLVGSGGVSGGSVSFGDVNGDGNVDLLITGDTGNYDPSTTLYLGDGDGGLTERSLELDGGNRGGDAAMGDLNDDGHLDIVSAGGQDFEASATVYLGNGSGGFSEAGAALSGIKEGSVSLGDLDADGNLDIVLVGGGCFSCGKPATAYFGDGTGGFEEVQIGQSGGESLALGDMDGDGNLDVVVETTVYLGDGNRGFEEAGAGLTGGSFPSLGDVDKDGNLDIVIGGGSTTTVYLGDGTGGFEEAGSELPTGGVPSLGDVNGDGNLDLVTAGSDGDGNKTTALYLGDGTGAFENANAGLVGVDRAASAFGDLDNDGFPELVVTGRLRPGQDFDDKSAVAYENLSEGNLLGASVSQSVSGNGSVDFGETGVDVNFSGTSGSGEVTVQKYTNGPSNAQGISESNVSSYRFVLSAGGDLTFDDSTEVRLDVSSVGGVGEASTVTVYKRSTRGSGPFSALTTSYDNGNNELVVETGSFSEFVLASNSSDNPLPVELAGFDATVDDDAVQLSWQTASETNNAGFRVQRKRARERGSENAWTTVGSVEGTGTTSEAQSYRFTDENLPYEADALTYRLKQVDTDGSEHFSDEITVERGVQELKLLGTYPNPARSRVTVRYALPEKQDVTVRLYDVLGRQVRTVVSGKQKGRHQWTLDVAPLPSGVYFLRLEAVDETRTQKLTVIR